MSRKAERSNLWDFVALDSVQTLGAAQEVLGVALPVAPPLKLQTLWEPVKLSEGQIQFCCQLSLMRR